MNTSELTTAIKVLDDLHNEEASYHIDFVRNRISAKLTGIEQAEYRADIATVVAKILYGDPFCDLAKTSSYRVVIKALSNYELKRV